VTPGGPPGDSPDAAPDAAVIRIPQPAVVVLVGAAGAGKSTFARRHFAAESILSSDELRAVIRGDPTDQTVTPVAFRILHRQLVKRLATRQSTVIDATNLTAAARATILRRAGLAAVPAIAIVLVPSPADVHARNAARPGGVVPADVVDRQLAAAAALGATRDEVVARLLDEGFAAVHVLASAAEIDAASVD
jgi:predicted kinase